jgi:hypothetical protein
LNCIEHNFEVDAKVVMNQLIAHARHLGPGDLGVFFSK